MLDYRGGDGLDLSDEAKLNLYETIGYLVGMPSVPVTTQARPSPFSRRHHPPPRFFPLSPEPSSILTFKACYAHKNKREPCSCFSSGFLPSLGARPGRFERRGTPRSEHNRSVVVFCFVFDSSAFRWKPLPERLRWPAQAPFYTSYLLIRCHWRYDTVPCRAVPASFEDLCVFFPLTRGVDLGVRSRIEDLSTTSSHRCPAGKLLPSPSPQRTASYFNAHGRR